MAKSGKVVGVGVDTPSIDRGINKEFIAHQVLTAANIYLMENLALTDAGLPPRGFQLIIMPMKITNGTGAPLRIVAQPVSSAATLYSRVLSWFLYLWVMIRNMFS
jgi:kynurenine formamidase